MPGKSICELKVELKAKGIKGFSGLNKSQLEALLRDGKPEAKKPAKPKPFVPAETKGESPKVAEKKISKKIRLPKSFYIPFKPPKLSKSSYTPFKAPKIKKDDTPKKN